MRASIQNFNTARQLCARYSYVAKNNDCREAGYNSILIYAHIMVDK